MSSRRALSLGLSGGLDLLHEDDHTLPRRVAHDSAVALVADGELTWALEEERPSRVKHTNRFPVLALRACAAQNGLDLSDPPPVTYYASEAEVDRGLAAQHLARGASGPAPRARAMLAERLASAWGAPYPPERLRFVQHHEAHALSAHALSGFEDSLSIVFDGAADGLSGLVAVAQADRLEPLAWFDTHHSLGRFYRSVCEVLGFGLFEEYKVMGLAPYGDPIPFREELEAMYRLEPDGGYTLFPQNLRYLSGALKPRRRSEPLTQRHHDAAAALQAALEAIALHVVDHHRARTGLRTLTLSGGVIQNCTLNGRILGSGRFDDVFVQPAAYDAGCALGAAIAGARAEGQARPPGRMRTTCLGPPLPPPDALRAELEAWGPRVRHTRPDDLAEHVAARLVDGAVVGWVQGRSEFGPRALGHRSILADPRPASHKDRVNAMVKKREAFRPFAPAVREEELEELFEVPPGATTPFMTFSVPVRERHRARLGATTHVDGSARVQSVSARAEPELHALLTAFGRRTGVGVLLNTSFNNDAEPMVEGPRDAIVGLLTTGLDLLVLGPYVVEKCEPQLPGLRLTLPPHVILERQRHPAAEGGHAWRAALRTTTDPDRRQPISAAAAALCADAPVVLGDDAPLDELEALWSRRLVLLEPTAAPAGTATSPNP